MARLVHQNDRYLGGKQVRLIDENNQPIGIVTFQDAMTRATQAGLDLVEVAGQATPPVCRIMDYGKFQYAEAKKQKAARKKQVAFKLKELKFHPNINDHDFEVKRNHAVDFLQHGCKVKIAMFFRGREMAHQDIGMRVLQRLITDVAAYGAPEAPLRRIGPGIITILAPKVVVKA